MNMGFLGSVAKIGNDFTGMASGISGIAQNAKNSRIQNKLSQDKFRQDRYNFDNTMDFQRGQAITNAINEDQNQGMSAISLLANQRANAMQQFKNSRFKTDLLKILG